MKRLHTDNDRRIREDNRVFLPLYAVGNWQAYTSLPDIYTFLKNCNPPVCMTGGLFSYCVFSLYLQQKELILI